MLHSRFSQKGFTLIELLAVVTIIAVLFILLIPKIGVSFEKARESGIKTDFRSYEIAARSFFYETSDTTKTIKAFNGFLNEELKFTEGVSKKMNPYGFPYNIYIDSDFQIVITSKGKKENQEYRLTLLYDKEYIDSTTYGFLDDVHKGRCIGGDSPSDFKFVTTNDTITIVSYLGSKKEVVIPCKINGKPVTKIVDSSTDPADEKYNLGFTNRNITSVIIPDTVKFIGEHAFEGNQLTSLILPSDLVTVESFAFYGNQLPSIIIPNKTEYIGVSSFSANKLKTVRMPSSLDMIDQEAFAHNEIKNIELRDGLVWIGERAFLDNALENVLIPGSIETISDAAFEYNKISVLKLSEGILDIGNYAFNGNNLESVIIPSTVGWVGVDAFKMDSLKEFTLLGDTFYEPNAFGSASQK